MFLVLAGAGMYATGTVETEGVMEFKPEDLKAVCQRTMPFGKYQNCPVIDLPEPYLLWFADKGFPKGELGRLMALAMIIKVEGLAELVAPFRGTRPGVVS